MKRAKVRWWVMGLMSAVAGGQGIHWLLTPGTHPGAPPMLRWAIIAQAVVGTALMAWCLARAARARDDE
jgi:hypothetical protein